MPSARCPVPAAGLADAYATNGLVDRRRRSRRVDGWASDGTPPVARRAGHEWGRDRAGRRMRLADVDARPAVGALGTPPPEGHPSRGATH